MRLLSLFVCGEGKCGGAEASHFGLPPQSGMDLNFKAELKTCKTYILLDNSVPINSIKIRS